MDKEAQLEELASIVVQYHIGCNFKKECFSECDKCCADAIYDSGYRKLPKDKPPLLSDEKKMYLTEWIFQYLDKSTETYNKGSLSNQDRARYIMQLVEGTLSPKRSRY